MIDVHCHILPGLDDGPGNIQDALKMARLAVKDGISTIVATPHCYDGVYNCQSKDIVACCENFNIELRKQGIALTVLPGAEIRFSPELSQAVEQGNALTLADGRDVLLLELPELFILDAVLMAVRSLKRKGITTLIAHPERNSMLMARPDVLKKIIEADALLQLTAGSLLGVFGRDSKIMAYKLLESGAPCYLASDGHCIKKRKPILKKAVKAASRKIGWDRAEELVSFKLNRNRVQMEEARINESL